MGFLVTALFPWLRVDGWADSQVFPKWLWVYAVAVVFGVAAAFGRTQSRNSRAPDMRIVASLVLVLAAALTSTALHYPGLLPGQALDWTAFGLLAVSFAGLDRDRRGGILKSAIWGTAASGAIASVWQVLQWAGPGSAFDTRFFGFQNHWAEYLGFGFVGVLAISRGGMAKDSRPTAAIAVGILTLLAVGIGFTHCRSVLFATFLGSLLVIATQTSRGKRSVVPALTILGLASLPFAVSKSLREVEARFAEPRASSSSSAPNLESIKEGNARVRLERWANTWSLALQSPWLGQGLGGFEFAYRGLGPAPDPENTASNVVRSPHNGYLELLVETGFPVALFILGVIAWIFRDAAIRRKHAPWALPLLAFWAVDALFAFPMELPFPFLSTALLCGDFLGESSAPVSAAIGYMGRLVSITAAIAVLYGGALDYRANQALQVADPFACEAFPSVWRTCLRSVDVLVRAGRWESAWNLAVANQKRFPAVDFFVSQKLALQRAATLRTLQASLYFGPPVR